MVGGPVGSWCAICQGMAIGAVSLALAGQAQWSRCSGSAGATTDPMRDVEVLAGRFAAAEGALAPAQGECKQA